jgi:hypothetical protein
MTKFTTFGIFEQSVKELIEELVAEPSIEIKGETDNISEQAIKLKRQALTDFFYVDGAEAFCNGEFDAIADALTPYITKERCFPCCYAPQVLGNKFSALNALRARFIVAFVQSTESVTTRLEDIYDSFMVNALNINLDFYKIEANVRSELKDYSKQNPDFFTEIVSKLNEFFMTAYKKQAAECASAELKERIEAHMTFIKEATELDIYTPRSRAALQARPSIHTLPLLPPPAAPMIQRSRSLDEKPTHSSNSLFAGFRRSSAQKDEKPHLPPEKPIRPHSM